ncbi:hypothetical protein OAS78_05475 [Pseudomonadales bacterium]|nr:hypothetical protein [Pseudomonadales bacterium]
MQISAVIPGGVGGSLSHDGAHLIQTIGVIASAVEANGVRDICAGAFLYAIN